MLNKNFQQKFFLAMRQNLEIMCALILSEQKLKSLLKNIP